ncbi:hypothetical protein [Nonomuraea sp. B19D2]|uniref:hypothetical protein n=1 Tax=Nonomuraea sp. B19D2 TaxID=3159561 RepID=UPI0032DB72B9
MAILVTEFNAYLDREDADPVADLIGYRQHAVWLTRGRKAAVNLERRRRDAAGSFFSHTPRDTRHHVPRLCDHQM